MKLGILISTITSVLFLMFAMIFDFNIIGIKRILIMYSFYPITYYIFMYYAVCFRIEKDNVRFTKIINIHATIYVICEIIGTYFFDVSAIIFSLYIASFMAIVYGMSSTRNQSMKLNISLSKKEKKQLVNYSFLTSINGLINNLTLFIDIFLVGVLVMDKNLTAVYKVGAIIPASLMFVPEGIIMFVYPYFAQHRNNIKWVRENTKRLFKVCFVMNLVISLLVILFSPLIIKILWGEKYTGATVILVFLSINYFFSGTFKYNIVNLLIAIREAKSILYINVASGVLLIIFDIVLIKKLGIVGATISSIMVTIITSLSLLPIMCRVLRKGKGDE